MDETLEEFKQRVYKEVLRVKKENNWCDEDFQWTMSRLGIQSEWWQDPKFDRQGVALKLNHYTTIALRFRDYWYYISHDGVVQYGSIKQVIEHFKIQASYREDAMLWCPIYFDKFDWRPVLVLE